MTRRRLPVVLAVLFVLVVAGTGATRLISVVADGEHGQTSVLTSGVPRLELRIDQGEVTVSPSPDADVHVRTRATYDLSRPELVERTDADGVLLGAGCTGWFGDCTVDYDIAVPAGFALDLQVVSGDVVVRGTTGPVTVLALSGGVAVDGVAGALDLSAHSGSITGVGVRSTDVRAETASGDVTLGFAAPPTTVTATTFSGDVDATLPGGPYRVLADTGSGATRVDVPQAAGAASTVRLETGSGDVTARRA